MNNPYTVAPMPLSDERIADWEEDALRVWAPFINRTTTRLPAAITAERAGYATRILALAAEVKRLRGLSNEGERSDPENADPHR